MKSKNGLVGPKPRKRGALFQDTQVISMTVYPRPRIKSIIVEAAQRSHLSVSNYVLRAAVESIARELKREPKDLLSEDDFNQLFDRAEHYKQAWRNRR